MSILEENRQFVMMSCCSKTVHPYMAVWNKSTIEVLDPEIEVRNFGNTPKWYCTDWETNDEYLYAATTVSNLAATLGGYLNCYNAFRQLSTTVPCCVYRVGGAYLNTTPTELALKNIAACLIPYAVDGMVPVLVSCYINLGWSTEFQNQIIAAQADSLNASCAYIDDNYSLVTARARGLATATIPMWMFSSMTFTEEIPLTDEAYKRVVRAGVEAGAKEFVMWNGAEYRLWVLSVTAPGPARAALASTFLLWYSNITAYLEGDEVAAFATALLNSSDLEELYGLYAVPLDRFLAYTVSYMNTI